MPVRKSAIRARVQYRNLLFFRFLFYPFPPFAFAFIFFRFPLFPCGVNRSTLTAVEVTISSQHHAVGLSVAVVPPLEIILRDGRVGTQELRYILDGCTTWSPYLGNIATW